MTRRLGSNRALVLDVLRHADRPLGAYAILDALRDAGVSGAPTVYRALDQLIRERHVKRVESLKAFVIQRDTADAGPVGLAICDNCGSTMELPLPAIENPLRRAAAACDFAVDDIVLELHGRCRPCASADTP